MGQAVNENLPLTETTFFILISLAVEPRHGYAIMQDVEELSDSRVLLSTGTLYGALRRLLEEGMVVRAQADEHGSLRQVRNRKYYVLTPHGKRVLEAEHRRLRRLVKLAELRGSEVGS